MLFSLLGLGPNHLQMCHTHLYLSAAFASFFARLVCDFHGCRLLVFKSYLKIASLEQTYNVVNIHASIYALWS